MSQGAGLEWSAWLIRRRRHTVLTSSGNVGDPLRGVTTIAVAESDRRGRGPGRRLVDPVQTSPESHVLPES